MNDQKNKNNGDFIEKCLEKQREEDDEYHKNEVA